MIKNGGVIPAILKLDNVFTAEKSVGTISVDDASLYISSEDEIILMIQAAEAFVNNDHKPAIFHANFFHRPTKPLLEDMHACHAN